MSEQTDAYKKVIEDLIVNYSGANEQFDKIDNAATSPCDVNQIVNNMPNMTLVRDNGGNVIGYDYKYTGPNNVDTTDMEVDSNSGGASFGTAAGGGDTLSRRGTGVGRYVGTFNSSSGFQAATDNNGNPLISGFIDRAWAAVSTMSKFSKNVGEDAAQFIENLGDHTAEFIHDYLVQSANNGADMIRALFGVDSQGNTTMYLDEDVIGGYAIQAKEDGVFNEGESTYDPTQAAIEHFGQIYNLVFYDTLRVLHVTLNDGTSGYFYTAIAETVNGVITRYHGYLFTEPLVFGSYLAVPLWGAYAVTFLVVDPTYYPNGLPRFYAGWLDPTFTFWSHGPYYVGFDYSIDYLNKRAVYSAATALQANGRTFTIGTDYGSCSNSIMSWILMYGSTYTSGGGIEGISDQDGATSPVDAITGADPHVVAQNLATQYPQVMGDPIQIVVLDDSCNEVTKKYYSIPISYSPTTINTVAPITGGLQVNPSFNPDVQLDLPDIDMSKYTEQIINQLRGSGTGRDVVINPDTGDPETLTPEPPNTGEGVTPPEVLPEATVTAMWHIYNPSSSELSSFGSWMWEQTIIDQIIRLFNNPMEAVIGLHAVFVEPHVSSPDAIVVGNIASRVSSNIVTKQYKSLNCGSVWLTEYFGNVFDYAPYTKVKLYLPFIGIVDLNVADVMRGEITVQYMVDVYTGACTATVSVNRDGVGGVLYQYSGNCAVEYPVSGASYSRMWQALASTVAVGLGGAATGNIAGAAGNMVAAAMSAKVDVAHSGSFSGNPGAMGIKKPYLIITRPQTNMAIDYERYDGKGSNYTARVGDCSGYIKCKEVHLNVPGAYADELIEIEQLLKNGILV